MGDVVVLDVLTRLNIPANRVLEGAMDKLETVIVVGYDHGGEEYFASSIADGGDAFWLLERCKRELLRRGDGE